MLNGGSARDPEDSGLVSSTAPTEDFDMQVMLDDGFFHREMDHTTTACDKPIPHLGQWRRIQQYIGNLCIDGCYSRPELARAARANAKLMEELTK